ncbi:hypothetical protein C9374_003205 [Naegleria lovaniensis]|uniref:F-box domain-containing protein n=1 Tax=Naegleria lovaniensis TaxID=51637 RepID=A0AA88GPQ3_NAELO|nr:uncharacterized protein C9374_003205 [Naegleria lovaniensis]KAG2386056.1 hypothetical protein C9374_003205 [Naegleria lovaniensis]
MCTIVKLVADHSENIFQKLPDELVGVIVGYLNSVELIFSAAKVCKYWRDEVVFPIVKEQYKAIITGIYDHSKQADDQFEITSMTDFYTKTHGQRFVKHMLRKCVFDYAVQLQKLIHRINNDDRVVECNPSWLDTELSILKQHFSNFSDVREGIQIHTTTTKVNISSDTVKTSNSGGGGIFKGVLDYMSSLFGGNKSTSSSTSTQTTKNPSNEKTVPKSTSYTQEFDFLFKSLLAGNYGAGKTSFLKASLQDTPSSHHADPTIGVDFGMRMFVLGNTSKIKLQMWDQCGPERFRSITSAFYRGARVIYFMIDLADQNNWLEQYVQETLKHAPDGAEIIVVGTKTDLHDKRKMLKRDLEKLAFETFNGSLYLEITNTKIEEPQTVTLYSVLLCYLLSVNKVEPSITIVK